MHVANLGHLRLRFHKFHMHLLHMIVQIPWKLECFSTSKTRKYLHFDMSVHVRLTISARCKLLFTQITLEWLFTIVDSKVRFELCHRKEGFGTFGTCNILLTCVPFLVSSQIAL